MVIENSTDTINEVSCGFPLTSDCTDVLNWVLFLLAGIIAFIIFLWQWNIRAHRRDSGQVKIILHLLLLKEKLEKYEKHLEDYFNEKISVTELAKQKEKRFYHLDQLRFAISISHDTMDLEIITRLDDILDYSVWNTVDNREVELNHNAEIISKINVLLETHLKKRSQYTQELLDKEKSKHNQ